MFDARATMSFRQRARESLRLARLAVRLAWRASPRLTLGILLLLLLQAALAPLQLALSRAVLDRAALDLGLAAAPATFAARLPLPGWIALAAGALALGQLIQPFSNTFQSLAGDRLTAYVTEQLIRAANRWQGLARFEDPAFADDLARAREHAARGGLELLVYGARALVSLFTTAALALTLVGLGPLVPILLVAATLPQMTRHWEYQQRTGGHIYVQTPEARRLRYSRDQLLTPEPAKDVHLYGLGPFFGGQYDAIFARTIAELDALRRRLMTPVALAGALAAMAAGVVYAYTVWGVARGERSLGELVLYGGAATLLQTNLLILGFDLGFLPMVLGFLPSLFRVLEAPPDLPVPANPRPTPTTIRRGIAFERVAFAYPGGAPVLRDVSFALRPGECLALVGHNGAGKTTLVKLLLRLYDPTAGRITLDGVDLRDYDLDDLRREMGVIFQDFVRYELTAGENIGLGRLDALGDPARLRAAAARAGAGDLLDQLPEGLDTPLGREIGGRELSGGEWQKLALARAFVRDCPLLVLDEPTAALDVQTEYDIYTRFRELTHDRATVLISHRFSTVRLADHILVLEDGRVVEAGSHAELVARGGRYAASFEMQAGRYRD
jgi:ATP-binding cassette subfamily B protein